jgi:hypothetical protein
LFRLFADLGFDGASRPDHVPTLEEEPNDHPGRGVRGMVFAVGDMKELLEGQRIACCQVPRSRRRRRTIRYRQWMKR